MTQRGPKISPGGCHLSLMGEAAGIPHPWNTSSVPPALRLPGQPRWPWRWERGCILEKEVEQQGFPLLQAAGLGRVSPKVKRAGWAPARARRPPLWEHRSAGGPSGILLLGLPPTTGTKTIPKPLTAELGLVVATWSQKVQAPQAQLDAHCCPRQALQCVLPPPFPSFTVLPSSD